MEKLRFKLLNTHPDFEKCLFIQRKIWNEELTPFHALCISVKTGAILLGAFFRKEMVGFVYSFPALFEKKLCQHSHHLAVLPQYQGHGIGKKLKWAQREFALKQGYEFITWTVDPLQAMNANLNLHALGAMCNTYLENFYGSYSSLTLGPNMPTDRFFMVWPIKEQRVRLRQKNKHEIININNLAKALEQKSGDDQSIMPCRPRLFLDQKFILAEIPKDIKKYRSEPNIILNWQKSIRKIMSHYFAKGFCLDDFNFADRCFYVLKKGKLPAESSGR